MIAEVLNSYEIHLEFLHRLVCDLSDEQMVAQPNDVPNHPAWTIGHLVSSCQAMGSELGIPVWLTDDWEERFGTGSTPVADATAYPDKEALLRVLDDGKDRLATALLSMGETSLAEPLPDLRYRDRFLTIGHAVVHSPPSFISTRFAVWSVLPKKLEFFRCWNSVQFRHEMSSRW